MTVNCCDYIAGNDTARSQAYTNDPASGSDILLAMADTSRFVVGASVTVSSSAGSENATVTAVDPNVSITVAALALDHTTSSPLVTLIGGTNISPYKTINKASTGLTGGDEVWCAKSADPSGLGGTLTFTDGSTSVATSIDMTGSLAANDFVGLNTAGETWWEIASLTSTTITLISKYVGTGGTGTGYKLGVTNTGEAAGSTTVVQEVSASGSAGSLIKISGGWNLSGTPGQDGQTWFWQSGGTKNGYGLRLSSKTHIDMDFGRVGFLRYNRGLSITGSTNNTITSVTCNSNGSYGIYLTSGDNAIISATCNGNANSGVYISATNNTITSVTCNSNGSYGIYLTSGNNTITSATCNSNVSYGIYLSGSSNNNTITSVTCNSNGTSGIYLSGSNSNTITSATCNGNTNGIYLSSSSNNTITSATCNSNSNNGISLSSSSNNTITSATCNSNSYGIYLSGGSSCVCWDYAHDESTWSSAVRVDDWVGNKQKCVSINETESGGAARNRVYFYGGYTQDNAAEAEGGSGKCLQFNPKSATYWIEQDFRVPVTASTARTVAIKMKDDASFNGTVELELWYLGVCIVGPTAKTMTESYASQEITATAGMIAADGVLTLKVKVYGTAGAVYADTLSYT